MSETNTEECGWSKEHLQQLFAAMKTNIQTRYMNCSYAKGLKTVDWDKVAFHPFSPEACQDKWRQILHKMRKYRSLAELIGEAEDVLLNPLHNEMTNPYFSKKPTPANVMFYEEKRAEFQKKHPELSHKEILGVLIKEYSTLSNEEKAPYEGKHNRATQDHRKRILKFMENDETPSKRKRTWKELRADLQIDDLPPKPPENGYQLFCEEQKSFMTGVSHKYVTVWAKRWRALTEGKKNQYSERCAKLKRQYAIKLNECLKTLNTEQRRILHENGINRSKKHNSKTKFPGEPKMPSRAGNVVFLKNEMERLKEEIPNSKKRLIDIQQRWKGLSSKEKEQYKGKVQENLKKYKLELQNWFKTLTLEKQQEYLTANPTKSKYLKATKKGTHEIEEQCSCIPSDSEDELIEESSSDEEENDLNSDEKEEEEVEDGDIMFQIY